MPHPYLADGRYDPIDLFHALPERVVPNHGLLYDSAAAAGLWILASFSPREDRIWRRVRPDVVRYAPMLACSGWSRAEKCALRIAANIATGRAAIDMSEAVMLLDERRWAAVTSALTIRRNGLRGPA
jgi:hypothetical protein